MFPIWIYSIALCFDLRAIAYDWILMEDMMKLYDPKVCVIVGDWKFKSKCGRTSAYNVDKRVQSMYNLNCVPTKT